MKISHFITALAIGTQYFLMSGLLLPLTESFVVQLWLRAFGGKRHLGLLFRIKTAVYLSRFPRLLPLLHALAASILVAYLAPYPNWEPILLGISFFAGFWLLPVFGNPAYSARKLPRFATLVAVKAVKQLVKHFPKPIQKVNLDWISRFPDTRSKIAAINGLMETTEAWAVKELEFMAKDPDPVVRASALEALELLHVALRGSGPLSLAPMEKLMQQYLELEGVANRAPLQLAAKRRMLTDFGEAIDNIVYSQVAYRSAFPDLYCKSCYARAEQLHFKEWQWVRCKRCHAVGDLVIGVQKVIGEIGGTQTWQLLDGELRIQLWDESQKKAFPAQVDELLIHANQAMDYDWAVSAVVQKLQDQSADGGQSVQVIILGTLELAQNTHHLLHSLDPNLKLD